MLSKSCSQYLRQRALTNAASLTYASQRNFAGGGAKKPPIPATETNFDVLFVGNYESLMLSSFINLYSLHCYRRHQCHCFGQVPAE